MKNLLMLLLLLSFCGYSQQDKSREGGGGSSEEIELVLLKELVKENIKKIDTFFKDQNAKAYFPEINFDKFDNVILNLKIEVTTKTVEDKYKISRTAVNYPSLNKISYNNVKLNNIKNDAVVLFVLNFHEILGLLHLEENDPNLGDLSLSYKISGRLARFVTKVESYDLKINLNENIKYQCLDRWLQNLPKDHNLKVNRDMPIIANTDKFVFYDDERYTKCFITTKEKSVYDRVVKANQPLKIQSVSYTKGNWDYGLYTREQKINVEHDIVESIICLNNHVRFMVADTDIFQFNTEFYSEFSAKRFLYITCD